jgi:predicted nucleic acid-binding protein
MTGKVFLDTNILLYAEFDDGSDKHRITKKLLLEDLVGGEVFVSTQVFNEFYVQAIRKGESVDEVEMVLQQYLAKFNVLPVDLNLVKNTWRIKKRYQFSYWDSLIVAASLESACNIVYTEDLQDGQLIENTLKVINPMLHERFGE